MTKAKEKKTEAERTPEDIHADIAKAKAKVDELQAELNEYIEKGITGNV